MPFDCADGGREVIPLRNRVWLQGNITQESCASKSAFIENIGQQIADGANLRSSRAGTDGWCRRRSRRNLRQTTAEGSKVARSCPNLGVRLITFPRSVRRA